MEEGEEYKVVLTGSFGVGKTSLFHRYIYDRFEERYSSSIGVRINLKNVVLADGSNITLKLWDLAGEVIQEDVPGRYFENCHVILYIFDVGRTFSYKNIKEDLEFLQTAHPDVLRFVVANKIDLFEPDELKELLNEIPAKIDFQTSAKDDINVGEMFRQIAESIKK